MGRPLNLSAGARETVEAVEQAIERASPERRTLAPQRARARTLTELLAALAAGEGQGKGQGRGPEGPPAPALIEVIAVGVATIAAAQLRAFPTNLFWDFDFMAATILEEARGAADPESVARARTEQIAGLQHLYGRETAIHFTYVHDFVYGYDWVKWIAREPPERRLHGPYSAVFLDYMHRRGHELLTLIDADDRKYGSLADDRPRNPFPFSREPAAELRLHRELARRGEIPVEAWRVDAAPRWNRRYAAIRAERARVLGLRPDDEARAGPTLRPGPGR